MKNVIDEKPTSDVDGRLAIGAAMVPVSEIKGKEMLDIGCGYGWFEMHAMDHGVKHITGTEVTETDLATVTKHITDDRTQFLVGSAIDLPFPDESFDTIVCWEVIEHIPKNTELKMFSEVHRLLRPGGTFYLSTPYRGWFSTPLDPAWWLVGHRHYNEADMERFAKEGGFELIKCFARGGIWQSFYILNVYFSKWVLRRGPIFSELFKRKTAEEYEIESGSVNLFAGFKKK